MKFFEILINFCVLAAVFFGQSQALNFNFCGLIFWPPLKPDVPPQPVPLTSISIHADVRGWTVGVTAQLEYKNTNTDDAIECEFVFPLADSSAVYQLDAEIAGRKLSAQIKERKEAETEYKEAVTSGHKAVLLESQVGSPDVYRLVLGNLPPNETATIKIGYVQPIDRIIDDGLLSVTLPVVLNPRYIPRHQINDSEVMAAKFHANVPYVSVSEVRYRMTFDASVNLGLSRQIADIKARHPNDTLEVSYGDGKLTAVVKLVENFTQDHDFQLLITPAKLLINKPMIYVEPGLATSGPSKSWLNYDVIAAWFEPPKGETSKISKISKDEYWLVVDRSGSMWGDKIKDAKSALALFVKSLPFGCKFNIVGFGSTFHVLFPNGTVDYEDVTITKAIAYSKQVDADLGGTEILEPLEHIYKAPLRSASEPDSRRFIVLLTDGEVFNTDEVIDLARKNAATTRVFAIGIGEGASTALVNGIARVSNGLAEFVRSASDRLQDKVISMLKATTQPSADNVTFEWQVTSGGQLSSTVPRKLESTAVFAGGSTSQYAVIDRLPDKDVQGYSKFGAEIAGNPFETRLNFEILSSSHFGADDPLPLHRLSAKKVLTEMGDEFATDHSEDVRKEAVAISIATGVLCEFTAFVAVDKGETSKANETAPPKKPIFITIERPTSYLEKGQMLFGGYSYRQPHMQSLRLSGRGGGPLMALSSAGLGQSQPMFLTSNFAPYPMVGMAQPPVPASEPAMAAESSVEQQAEDYGVASVSEEAETTQTSPRPGVTTTISKNEQLMDLLMAQNFNGSWTLNDDFVANLHLNKNLKTVEQLRKAVRDLMTYTGDHFQLDDHFVATTFALAVLRHRFEDEKSQWQLIEEKAVDYLNASKYPGDIDTVISELEGKL